VLESDPAPLLEERHWEPEPIDLMLTTRGPGARPMACLSVKDNLWMLACLARCQEALAERFSPTDGRRDLLFSPVGDPRAVSWVRAPFTMRPYEEARTEFQARRRAFARSHYGQPGWALRIDVSSCGYSLDYRRLLAELPLPKAAARVMLRLLQHLRVARRHGIRSFGNCLGLLVKTYLHPVVAELDRRGHRFFLADLDEFHLFAPTRRGVLELAQELEVLLRARGLTLNQGKSRLAPSGLDWRPFPVPWARLAPWLPRATLVAWLRNDRYTSRGPAFRDLLHAPFMQDAAANCLRDPETRRGDRWQVLYWLDVAGVSAQGDLRRYLEANPGESDLERSLVRGALADRSERMR